MVADKNSDKKIVLRTELLKDITELKESILKKVNVLLIMRKQEGYNDSFGITLFKSCIDNYFVNPIGKDHPEDIINLNLLSSRPRHNEYKRILENIKKELNRYHARVRQFHEVNAKLN
jgi:hypothetical protein